MYVWYLDVICFDVIFRCAIGLYLNFNDSLSVHYLMSSLSEVNSVQVHWQDHMITPKLWKSSSPTHKRDSLCGDLHYAMNSQEHGRLHSCMFTHIHRWLCVIILDRLFLSVGLLDLSFNEFAQAERRRERAWMSLHSTESERGFPESATLMAIHVKPSATALTAWLIIQHFSYRYPPLVRTHTDTHPAWRALFCACD